MSVQVGDILTWCNRDREEKYRVSCLSPPTLELNDNHYDISGMYGGVPSFEYLLSKQPVLPYWRVKLCLTPFQQFVDETLEEYDKDSLHIGHS